MSRGDVKIRVLENDVVTGVGIALDDDRAVYIEEDGTLTPVGGGPTPKGYTFDGDVARHMLRISFQVGRAFLAASKLGCGVRVNIDMAPVTEDQAQTFKVINIGVGEAEYLEARVLGAEAARALAKAEVEIQRLRQQLAAMEAK